MTDRENQLIEDLASVIYKHVDWLSGRDFQRLTERAARAYFEADDLDDLGTFDDLRKSFETAAQIAAEAVSNGR